MSLLRHGIAGFGPSPTVDFRKFKRAVYAAAQATGAIVIATTAGEGVTPNFHQADIDLDADEISVVCNRSYPVIAFAARPVEMAGIRPVDVPSYAEVMRSLGFEVAAAEELNRSLNPADLQMLSSGEQKEARYWKPRRVADVVFNWWD